MLDSWEDMQIAWTSSDTAQKARDFNVMPDQETMQKMVRKSIWRSYGISVFVLTACVFMIWELSFVTWPQFTILKVGIIGLGAVLIAIWRVYLHLSFARNVSTTNLEYRDYLRRHIHLRKRSASASLGSVFFMLGIVILLALPSLWEQSFAEFFTPKRAIGLPGIACVLVWLGVKAQRSRNLAQQELISLSIVTAEMELLKQNDVPVRGKGD